MSIPMLSVEGVLKRYGDKVAVENASLRVSSGEILALLGPNGAGKTTLLRMISGIVKPDKGFIKVGGFDPFDPRARALIGYCPQEPVVYDDLTGLENLLFYAGLHGLSGAEAKGKCVKLLKFMGLSDYADKLVKTYSGGMKKKLSFAIALIGDPQILILDEPTTGMDPQARREVWEKIVEMKQEKRAIILATHYMEEAEALADRVIIMNQGKMIAEGSPEELKMRYGPKAVVTVKLLDYSDEVLDALKTMASEGKLIHENGEVKIHVENPDEAAPRIVSEILKRGTKLELLRITRPTLEDVFLRLTGRRLSE